MISSLVEFLIRVSKANNLYTFFFSLNNNFIFLSYNIYKLKITLKCCEAMKSFDLYSIVNNGIDKKNNFTMISFTVTCRQRAHRDRISLAFINLFRVCMKRKMLWNEKKR